MISTVGMTVASQNQLDCWLEGSVLGRRTDLHASRPFQGVME